MPLRRTSITSSSVAGRRSSISRFFRLARIVPRTRVRSLSCALRAAFNAARRVEARSDTGDTGTTPALANCGVHFPLPLFARLFEVTVLPKIRQNSGLFALLLEPFLCPIEALCIVNDDLWHSLTHPSRPNKGR